MKYLLSYVWAAWDKNTNTTITNSSLLLLLLIIIAKENVSTVYTSA